VRGLSTFCALAKDQRRAHVRLFRHTVSRSLDAASHSSLKEWHRGLVPWLCGRQAFAVSVQEKTSIFRASMILFLQEMTILPPSASRPLYAGLVVILAAVMVGLLLPALPYLDRSGTRDARRDIARGELRIKMGIRRSGLSDVWAKALRDQFDIEIERETPSCFPNAYRDQYNRVQREEIVRRFGADVVTETWYALKRDRPKE